MTGEMKALLYLFTTAALALLIIISLFWWVYALSHGVFAVGPFIALMASVILAGVLSKDGE